MMKKIVFLLLFVFSVCSAFAASATIKKVWLEHDVELNGKTAMKVHCTFDVADCQNKEGSCCIWLYDENKNNHLNSSGKKYFELKFTPRYEETTFNDLWQALYVSDLNLKPSKHTYYIRVIIYDSKDNILAKSDYISFTGTGNEKQQTPSNQLSGAKYGYPRFPNVGESVKIYVKPKKLKDRSLLIAISNASDGVRFELIDYASWGTNTINTLFMSSKNFTSTPNYYSFRGFNSPKYRKAEFRISKDWKTLEFVPCLQGMEPETLRDANFVRNYGKEFEVVSEEEYNRCLKIQRKRVQDFNRENPDIYIEGKRQEAQSLKETQELKERQRKADENAPCSNCKGGKVCPRCEGTGTLYSAFNDKWMTCTACNGSRKCYLCKGSGKRRRF